jgi:hypothetical protein
MRLVLLLLVVTAFARPALADYTLFYENGKAGVKDETGNVLIPASFDALGWSDGSFSVVNSVTGYRREGRWGLINLKKELITKPEFDNLGSGGGDRVIASKWINPYSKKFGCLDLHGTVTVPFRYEAIQILGLRAIVCEKNGAKYQYGVIDLNDRSVLKIAFREIRPIGTLRFAVQDFNKKTALYSEDGARLTEFNIDSISSFNKGIALIYENLKVGAMNRSGEIVVAPSFRKIEVTADGALRGVPFSVWKEIDGTNKEIKRIVADSVRADYKGYVITLSGMNGLVDKDFAMVLSPKYDQLLNVGTNLRIAYAGGKGGIIRNNGDVVVPFEHDSLLLHGDLLRSLQVRGGLRQWTVYDTFGIRKTEKTYDELLPYNGRFFPAKRNGYWGAVDRYGKEVFACVYDSIINSSYELTAVKFKRGYGIISRNESWMVTPQRYPLSVATDDLYFEKNDSVLFVKKLNGEILYFSNNSLSVTADGFREVTPDGNAKKITWEGISVYESAPPSAIEADKVFEESEGFRGIQRDGRYGFIDKRGRLRIANRYEDIGRFSEGLAAVRILGKWGFVNTEDKIVVNPNYETASEFSHGVSVVRRNNQYGVISKDGTVLLPLRYDSIRIKDNLLLLHANGKTGLANLSGHVLIEPRFEKLQVLPGERVLVSDGMRWGVLTSDGLPIIPMIYDALGFNETTGNFLAREDRGWNTLQVPSEK